MEVWYAETPAGMSPNKPAFDRATLVGQVCDVFKDQMAGIGGWEQASSMEAVLDLLHIEYARMICGYSLHKRAVRYGAKVRGLDWYYQDAALRGVGRTNGSTALYLIKFALRMRSGVRPEFWRTAVSMRDGVIAPWVR